MPTGVSVLGLPGAWNQVDSQNVGFGLTNQMPPEIALEEQALNRKQQLANALIQRSLQPIQGQMAGRFYVPPHWAQGLAQLGMAGMGAYLTSSNDDKRKGLADQSNTMLSDALSGYQKKIAPQEVETAPADTRSVNGSGVEPGLPFGIDPHVMPSQGWDINKYQPDPYNQIQENKNAIALNTPQPQAQEEPLAGVPQQMNPWTMELVGQPNSPPSPPPLVDALQQRYDRGEHYTRRPFQDPTSDVTVSPAQTQMMPRSPEEKRAALVELMASQHPQARAIAQFMAKQDEMHQEKVDQRAFLHEEKALDRASQAEQKGLDREARLTEAMTKIDQMTMMGLIKQEDAKAMKEQAIAQARQHDETLKEIARIGAQGKTDSAHIKADAAQNKPMPTPALKLQNESLDIIGTAATIKSDLGALRSQISEGKINLGFLSNWLARGKNAAGMSSEQSRNFASFENTLNKMRNDSLRLNKGVQTEGDAQRAWGELFQSLNDPQLVMQRLQEIEAINDRALNLQKLQVDTIRQNYGQDPFDFSKYETQPAAVGGGGAAPSTGGWSIRPLE